MIISSLCSGGVVRVVRIVVIWPVLEVGSIQCLHSQRSTQVLIRKPKCAKSVYRIEQFWCHNHCNREIWPELIVRPLPPGPGPENVLIDSSAVYEPCGDLVRGI